MGFWRRWLARVKSTTSADNPAQWLVDWVRGGAESATGITVSAASALRCAAVYACVQVVSQDVAKLPLPLYRRLPGGDRERVTDDPLYRLVAEQPNEWQTSFEWREMMQGHLELRGNAYSHIERDGRGRPLALWPLHPDCVQVRIRDDWRLVYDYRAPRELGGETVTLQQDDVLHLRERSENGIVGLSRIAQMREAIGLALAMEEHGARLFSNGALFSGVLETDKVFADSAEADRARELFAARYQGLSKFWKPALLHNGLKWKQMSMTADDSQFIESRGLQVAEIARGFRVPPHKIGDLTRSTNNNIEHQALEYVVDSLLPRLRRFEMRLNRALVAHGDLYFEFLVDGLLRGDLNSRYAAFGLGRQWGFLSVNDIRRLENMNGIGPSGDIYLQPINMFDAAKPPPAAPPPGGDQPENEQALRVLRALIDERLEALARPAPRLNGAGKEGHGHA